MDFKIFNLEYYKKVLKVEYICLLIILFYGFVYSVKFCYIDFFIKGFNKVLLKCKF